MDRFSADSFRANGYTDPDRHTVVLSSALAPPQSAMPVIHEAAHIHLGRIDTIDEHRQHRGRTEVEAESVAYIVAGLVGFNQSSYSIGYITGRADEDLTLIRETAARVLQAAQLIANVTAP